MKRTIYHVNFTTFEGMCPGASHYYAKLSWHDKDDVYQSHEADYTVQEKCPFCKSKKGCDYCDGKGFTSYKTKRFPTKAAAMGGAILWFKALPILDKAGIHCTFYTITQLVGQPGYVTVVQLQSVAGRGHEIGNHTRTHPYLSTVSPTQLTSETSGAEGDFPALFNIPTPQTFAYPYDDYGNSMTSPVVAAVKASGVRGARDSDYGGYNVNTSYPLLLDSMPSEYDLQTDNVATVTGWINQAVNNGMWVIILWHRVDETDPNNPTLPNPINVPSTVIQGVVDYIQANGIHTATDSEGLVIENLDARKLP